MAQTATVFGLIWAGLIIASGMIFNIGMDNVVDLFGTDPAQAATVWLAIESVFEGMGGGNEIVGGIWILLVSWAALRAGEFSRILNYLGLVLGVAGILSAVPTLANNLVHLVGPNEPDHLGLANSGAARQGHEKSRWIGRQLARACASRNRKSPLPGLSFLLSEHW